jgi:hypothetical protein
MTEEKKPKKPRVKKVKTNPEFDFTEMMEDGVGYIFFALKTNGSVDCELSILEGHEEEYAELVSMLNSGYYFNDTIELIKSFLKPEEFEKFRIKLDEKMREIVASTQLEMANSEEAVIQPVSFLRRTQV